MQFKRFRAIDIPGNCGKLAGRNFVYPTFMNFLNSLKFIVLQLCSSRKSWRNYFSKLLIKVKSWVEFMIVFSWNGYECEWNFVCWALQTNFNNFSDFNNIYCFEGFLGYVEFFAHMFCVSENLYEILLHINKV